MSPPDYIDPYDYLVDVLQRIDRHPASQVEQLTPRVWKTLFAANPLRSDLYLRDERHNSPQRRAIWLIFTASVIPRTRKRMTREAYNNGLSGQPGGLRDV